MCSLPFLSMIKMKRIWVAAVLIEDVARNPTMEMECVTVTSPFLDHCRTRALLNCFNNHPAVTFVRDMTGIPKTLLLPVLVERAPALRPMDGQGTI